MGFDKRGVSGCNLRMLGGLNFLSFAVSGQEWSYDLH